MNLEIKRHFTKELEGTDKHVFDLFDWETTPIKMCKGDGTVIYQQDEAEFPVKFSQDARDIIASKYFRQTVPNQKISVAVPDITQGREHSYKQLVHRMVSFWTLALMDEKAITDAESYAFYDEVCFMMISQMWAPNSPQFFNTGLELVYGIQTKAENLHRYSPEKNVVESVDSSYTFTQGSGCYILGVEDSMLGPGSITDTLRKETTLFKYGSGVGANWSNIRGAGEPLSGGGKSSGLMSFLGVFDKNAGAIKSGGTTRRAAKMNVLNHNHPEIYDFVKWKAKEEQKVRDLGKMGYDVSMEGEAYATVSGQNVNNSVSYTNEFMDAVCNETYGKFNLISPVTGLPLRETSVDELWCAHSLSAWECGDPGVQFTDTINKWHTCPAGMDGDITNHKNRINSSNPCSEYMFIDDSACNLASIKVTEFLRGDQFDLVSYMHVITLSQLILEATIHWGCYPDAEIAKNSYLYRTTGLGMCDLGSLFILKEVEYGSRQSCVIAAQLSSVLTSQAYITSALIAKRIGTFPAFETNKEYMLNVIEKHKQAYVESNAWNTSGVGLNQADAEYTRDLWATVFTLGSTYGYRNAQVTLIAPTGTISFAMDCHTSSTEPMYLYEAYKKLIGGAVVKQLCEPVKVLLEKYHVENIYDLPAKIQPVIKGANEITWVDHLRVMSAIQPFISGAISKTVNLAASATVEDVSAVYKTAYQMGLKAVALFRDGCKAAQPLSADGKTPETIVTYNDLEDSLRAATDKIVELNNKLAKHNNMPVPSYTSPTRIKPSGIRRANVHEASINGLKLYITVSFYGDGRIAEIYVSSGRQGSLTKGLLDGISTTVSEFLQYGIPAKDIAKMYRGSKFEPSGFVQGHPHIRSVDSILDLISKIIEIELGDYSNCQVKPTKADLAIKQLVNLVRGSGYNADLVTTSQSLGRSEILKSVSDALDAIEKLNDYDTASSEPHLKHLESPINTEQPHGIKAGSTGHGMSYNTSSVCTEYWVSHTRKIVYQLDESVPDKPALIESYMKDSPDLSQLSTLDEDFADILYSPKYKLRLVSNLIDVTLDKNSSRDDRNRYLLGVPDGRLHSIHNSTPSASDYIHGEVCHNCHLERLVKSGTCKTCTNCGETTGCS